MDDDVVATLVDTYVTLAPQSETLANTIQQLEPTTTTNTTTTTTVAAGFLFSTTRSSTCDPYV